VREIPGRLRRRPDAEPEAEPEAEAEPEVAAGS
jgi:hypothetical protein